MLATDEEVAGRNVVECWACAVLISIPEVDGCLAPLFRCGWCGAINDHCPGARPGKAPRSACAKFLRLLGGPLRGFVVGFVVLIVAFIGAVGIGVVLPRAFPSPLAYALHVALAALLLACTCLHYAAVCFTSPGRVRECVAMPPRAAAGHYPEGSFEGWMFCRHTNCQAAKPPGTHHCSTCGFCVVELDHHCPFINNCVGRANLRAFILFLAWVCASCGYAMGVCLWLLWQSRALVAAVVGGLPGTYRQPHHPAGHGAVHYPAARAGGPGGGAGGGHLSYAEGGGAGAAAADASWLVRMAMTPAAVLAASPWWLLGTYYLLLVCSGVLLCCGLLLAAQLRHLASGMTYIELLKREEAEKSGSGYGGGGGGPVDSPGLWQRLSEVMGGSNALMWLLPHWQPPPGVMIADSKKAS